MSRQRSAWLAVVVSALLVGGCAAARNDGPEIQRLHARALYEQGLAHMRDKQPSLALTAIQEAISLDPTIPVYPNALGLLYLQELLRPDLALEQFRRAFEIDPTYAEAELNVGIALAEQTRWPEAVAAYRKAISLPTLPVPHIAYQNLGLALYHLKQYREAEETLRFAIGLDPTMQGAYYNLGLVFVAEERQEDAKLAFRRARDLAPTSPFGHAAAERLKALGEGG